MVSESARYYQTHPAARERKKKYDTRFESSPTQKAKRRELARHNAEHDKKYGQHPEGGWMLHIPSQESDINLHR